MRSSVLLPVLFTLLVTWGCAPSRPLTPEELAGFCNQQSTGNIVCNNIVICGEYKAVLEMQQESQAQCMDECRQVYDNQMRNRDPLDKCWYVSNSGYSLCQKYCREAYPK